MLDFVLEAPDEAEARRRTVVKIQEVEQLTASADEQAAAARSRRATRTAWFKALSNAVLDAANVLPARTEDYEMRQLLYFLHELRMALDADDTGTDPDQQVALATIKISDVASRLRYRLQHAALEAPDAAAAYVLTELRVLSATELSELLGVTTKTVAAWRHSKPVRSNVDRVVLLARLVAYLRSSMTARGVYLWVTDAHDRLDGRRPLDMLTTPDRRTASSLLQYARGGRAQLAD